MCPPPQIASLPAPKSEQLDPPEHLGSGGYQLIRWGMEDAAEDCGSKVPIGPRGMAMLGKWGIQCLCKA